MSKATVVSATAAATAAAGGGGGESPGRGTSPQHFSNTSITNQSMTLQPLLPAVTTAASSPLSGPSSPAFSHASTAPTHFNGWLHKFSVGTSTFGRKNWQLRFFKSDESSIQYSSSCEGSDLKPKRTIQWKDVTHVYEILNSGMHKQASDPERFYFGIRFYGVEGSSTEHVLLMRTDSPQERLQWTAHFLAVHMKHNNFVITEGGFMQSSSPSFHATSAAENNNTASSAATAAAGGLGGGGGDGAIQRRAAKERGWLVEAVAQPLRNMVSLKKKRFQEGGYDLDLAYIDDDIVAMGFPCEGKDAVFRNPMDQVVKFLEERHGKRFHVFNLCSERFYPPSAFEGKFDRFPFDDHNAPPIDLLLPFCYRAAEILRRPVDAQGKPWAVAIHCKAGKGRTGAMICALLMYLGRCSNDKESLEYFARKRTKDAKGVQIPSQIRYIEYFYWIRSMYGDMVPPPVKVMLKTIILSSIPHFDSDGGADPFVLVQQRRETHGHRPLGTNEGNVHNPLVTILDTRTVTPAKHVIGVENYPVEINCLVSGDIRIVLLDQDGFGKDELMAAFWFYTSFLPKEGQLVLKKKQLDFAVKEKTRIDENFNVVLKYEILK